MSKLTHREAIEAQLRELKSDLPKPRILNLAEKMQLIAAIGGPKTVRNIIKASHSLPLSRIPFLFSSLDCQLVIDVLANDMDEALSQVPGKARR